MLIDDVVNVTTLICYKYRLELVTLLTLSAIIFNTYLQL